MNSYYDDLRTHPDDARVVGWESRLAQLVRFEAVRCALTPGDSLLDLGAGLGDLGRYLALTNPDTTYTGIEARPAFVAQALTRQPPIALLEGDAFDDATANKADVVAVVGALVDGRKLTDRTARFSRLRRIITASMNQARRLVVLVVARQDRLDADPIRSLEPSLGGIETAEIPWLVPEVAAHLLITDLLPNDYVLFIAHAAQDLPTPPPSATLRANAMANALAADLPPEALIRFHLELGEPAPAARLMTEHEANPGFKPDAAWRLLRARLALAAGDA